MKTLTQQIQNKLFIVLSISLLMTLSPSFVFAQNPSTQIEIDFSQIQGVSAGKEIFTLEVKDSKVDVSHIIERIRNLMSQSAYRNASFTNSWHLYLNHIQNQIRSLCSSLTYMQYECQSSFQEPLSNFSDEIYQRFQQRFLYPDDYHPIGSLSSQVVERANLTSCCYDQNVAKTILYGSSSQHDQIITKLKNLGTSCLKQAGHAVIENLQSHTSIERPDSFSFCRYITNREDKTRCDQLQSDYEIIQERLISLTNLVREDETPLVNRSFTQLEDIANNNSLTSQISLFKRNLEDHQSCRDYGIGEERIKSSSGYAGGGYIIKRNSNGDYTANVFIEFVPGTLYDNEDQVPRDQVQNHYRQRVQACIDRANPYLKGPNGQRLNIVIRTPNASSCVPKNTITIWNYSYYNQAQAENYPSNLNDCAIITHEVLHKLGLADEHRGPDTYYPLPPRNSDRYLSCSMNEENSIMNIDDAKKSRWANVFDSATEDSLLDPTHFNVILYRGCSQRDDVSLYKECELPLQTTEHYSCLEKKFYCDNQNILGRDKLRELQRIDRMLQEVTYLQQQNRGFIGEVGGIYSNFLYKKGPDPYVFYGSDIIIQTLENRRRVVESWPDN